MNPLLDKYRKMPLRNLLRVLENPFDYKPEAVEAAEVALEERKLDQEELASLTREVKAEMEEKRKKEESFFFELDFRLPDLPARLLSSVNPLQGNIPNKARFLNLVTLFFLLFTTYYWYSKFGLFQVAYREGFDNWSISVAEVAISLTMVTTGAVFFWLREKLGWMLIIAVLSYISITSLGLVIQGIPKEGIDVYQITNLFPPLVPAMISSAFFISLLISLILLKLEHYFDANRKLTLIALIPASIAGFVTIIPIIL
ncbi:MAG: hypothetical protein AAGI38_07215 [Bacteroidota bacterium]